ncbi:MAG: hypothetical protein RL115_1395 [Bacteroidota bacterium]|jgi:hypothetical protein
MNIRQLLDLFSIILPAGIVLLGILRLFVSPTKVINSVIMFLAIVLLVMGLVRYFILGSGSGSTAPKGPKPVPLTVSKHSTLFNTTIQNTLATYYKLTDGFLKKDTLTINKSSADFLAALNSVALEELKMDTLIYQTALQPYENIKTETVNLIAAPDLETKKAKLHLLSNELFAFIQTARYDLGKLYWQECGHALGEDLPGNWFSPEAQSSNPYGLANCAELKTTIDFVPSDTTKNP